MLIFSPSAAQASFETQISSVSVQAAHESCSKLVGTEFERATECITGIKKVTTSSKMYMKWYLKYKLTKSKFTITESNQMKLLLETYL